MFIQLHHPVTHRPHINKCIYNFTILYHIAHTSVDFYTNGPSCNFFPIFSEIMCPIPIIMNGDFTTQEPVMFETTVTLTCNKGYLITNETSNTKKLQCLASGTLSEASCEGNWFFHDKKLWYSGCNPATCYSLWCFQYTWTSQIKYKCVLRCITDVNKSTVFIETKYFICGT